MLTSTFKQKEITTFCPFPLSSLDREGEEICYLHLMFNPFTLNTFQVFRLQVNNGIPIKSWFDDPLDCALMSLLPFLETLAEADDVRPIIAKRYGNKE